MTLKFGNNNNNNNNNKAKVKTAPVYAMKTFIRESRGVALLILHLAARWW